MLDLLLFYCSLDINLVPLRSFMNVNLGQLNRLHQIGESYFEDRGGLETPKALMFRNILDEIDKQIAKDLHLVGAKKLIKLSPEIGLNQPAHELYLIAIAFFVNQGDCDLRDLYEQKNRANICRHYNLI